jgi:hypothetical protein
VGPTGECWLLAARYGAVLGALATAHHAGTGARNAAYPAVARPRHLRIKRAAVPAALRGAKLAVAAAVVGLYTLHLAYPALQSAWFQPLCLSSEKRVRCFTSEKLVSQVCYRSLLTCTATLCSTPRCTSRRRRRAITSLRRAGSRGSSAPSCA